MTHTGFTVLALCAFARNMDSLGAMFFVLSLGFKQMALYYAPAIGTYLLAKCIYLGPQDGSVSSVHPSARTCSRPSPASSFSSASA
jgi:alpha-1,3-glucosyltransferase